jgi:conjugative transfer pilus assembly protein TraH
MLRDSRNNFRDISIRTSQRFDQVFALIQRTQMVEKQLKSQLTPKMVGALRFSRSVGGRM